MLIADNDGGRSVLPNAPVLQGEPVQRLGFRLASERHCENVKLSVGLGETGVIGFRTGVGASVSAQLAPVGGVVVVTAVDAGDWLLTTIASAPTTGTDHEVNHEVAPCIR